MVDTSHYDKVSAFDRGFARVEKDSLSFYINNSGNRVFEVIRDEYRPLDSVASSRNGMFHVYKNEEKLMRIVSDKNHYGLVNELGQEVIPTDYDSIALQFKRYLALYKNGKMSYADTWGNLLLPLKFTKVSILSDGLFVVEKDGKKGIFNQETQKIVIPLKYEDFDYCSGCGKKSGYAYARKNRKWGVIDFANNILVPFDYQSRKNSRRSDHWVTAFEKDGKNIIINIQQQKEYGAPQYASGEILNGMLIIKKDGKYGVINSKGQELTPFIYDQISDPSGSLDSGNFLLTERNGKYGIVDTLGNTVIPVAYENKIYPKANYFLIKEEGKYGLLDTDNKQVLSSVYNTISEVLMEKPDSTKTSVFSLQKGEFKGMFFPETKVFIPTIFHQIRPYYRDQIYYNSDFPSNLIKVEKNSKIGFYSLDGKQELTPEYLDVEFVNANKAVLQKSKESGKGLYDLEQRKLVIPYQYKQMDVLPEDSAFVKVEKNIDGHKGQYGILDFNGNEILPILFQQISHVTKNFYLTRKNDSLYSIWNSKQRTISELPFRHIRKANDTPLLIVQDKTGFNLYNVVTKKLLLQKSYSEVSQLKNGHFIVFNSENPAKRNYGYANPEGKLIVPVEYDTREEQDNFIYQHNQYLPLFKQDRNSGKMLEGFAGLDGAILVPAKYEKVYSEVHGNGFLTRNGNRFGVITAKGEEILPPKYEVIPDQQFSPYNNDVEFTFPVLFGKEDHWQFINNKGIILPIKARGHTSFFKRKW